MKHAGWVRTVASKYKDCFPKTPVTWRTVGREAEYPVVRSDNGSWGDVHWLLHTLAAQDSSLTKVWEQGPKYTALETQRLVMVKDQQGTAWTAEVGGGTVEVIVGPCDDLHELDRVHNEALERLRRAAEAMTPGLRILGLGMQPLSPPSHEMLIDRQRYRAMSDALRFKNWKWFAVTASDQIHVDMSQDELVVQLNAANALAPAFAALCGNSSLCGGGIFGRAPDWEDAGEFTRVAVSGRDQALMSLARYGLPEHQGLPEHWPLHSLEDWVQDVSQLPYLLRPRQLQLAHEDGVLSNFPTAVVPAKKSKSIELVPPEGGHLPFAEYVQQHQGVSEQVLWDEFVSHERYVWHAGRPRWGQGTVEYRAVCQQPHQDRSVSAALSLGWAEKGSEVWDLLSSVGGTQDASWGYLSSWWRSAVALGLSGKGSGADDGELLRELVRLCEQGLRERGRGEEVYLGPVWARLAARENPGQAVRRIFLEQGTAAALKHAEGTLE